MAEVNVTSLRQHLPEFLARVGGGERIQLMSLGRVVAEIAPPLPTADSTEAARVRLRGSVVCDDVPLQRVLPAEEWGLNR